MRLNALFSVKSAICFHFFIVSFLFIFSVLLFIIEVVLSLSYQLYMFNISKYVTQSFVDHNQLFSFGSYFMLTVGLVFFYWFNSIHLNFLSSTSLKCKIIRLKFFQCHMCWLVHKIHWNFLFLYIFFKCFIEGIYKVYIGPNRSSPKSFLINVL